jgi:hypothetical protein
LGEWCRERESALLASQDCSGRPFDKFPYSFYPPPPCGGGNRWGHIFLIGARHLLAQTIPVFRSTGLPTRPQCYAVLLTRCISTPSTPFQRRVQCRGRESNPHGNYFPTDFKFRMLDFNPRFPLILNLSQTFA